MSNENNEKKSGPALSEEARVLEAILFASDEVVTAAKLKEIMPDNPDARHIRKLVSDINIQLQRERHPFEIVELGGGYQFRTVSYYQPWVQRIFKEKAAKKLSIQALECLAIIAYKQPITKASVETIRGVMSDGAMKTLLEKHLVDIVGRSEKPGRPLLYGTTSEFLKYFGINKLADLPDISEFEALAKEKMEQFSDEELEAAGIQTEMEMSANGETVISNEESVAVENEVEIVTEESTDEIPVDESEFADTVEVQIEELNSEEETKPDSQ